MPHAKKRKPGKSIPYHLRSPAGKSGQPQVRLPQDFGEICARVVDEGLVEPASVLLEDLLEKHGKDEPK